MTSCPDFTAIISDIGKNLPRETQRLFCKFVLESLGLQITTTVVQAFQSMESTCLHQQGTWLVLSLNHSNLIEVKKKWSCYTATASDNILSTILHSFDYIQHFSYLGALPTKTHNSSSSWTLTSLKPWIRGQSSRGIWFLSSDFCLLLFAHCK